MSGLAPGSAFASLAPEGPEEPGPVWMPETDADRAAVCRQLECILGSPQFKTGSRGPALFRYLVENALAGHSDLKERTVGIEVFGREPAYDTNLDPVVRVTASRIRHRLARYYEDPGHRTEIRIALPAGSYVPVFRLQSRPSNPGENLPTPVNGEDVHESAAGPFLAAVGRGNAWLKYATCAFAVVLATGLLLFAMRSTGQTGLDLFWGPVLDSPGPVLVCMGTGLPTSQRDSVKPDSALTIIEQRQMDIVSWPDALTMSRLTGFLIQRRKPFQVQRDSGTSLATLRSDPAVFIGAFNNRWVLRLAGQGRFRFENDKLPSTMSIVDAQSPVRRDWSVVTTAPFSEFKEDYGMVMRILDPTTERMVVVAGGLGSYGTVAAGEFLTTPRYMQLLAAGAPPNWARKNLQVVFKTRVIEGGSGPPQILDTYFW
jgi:hypothetical protein